MTTGLEGAAYVIGMLVLFGLALVGAVVVGVLSVLGLSTLTGTLGKVNEADALIQAELERLKLEELGR